MRLRIHLILILTVMLAGVLFADAEMTADSSLQEIVREQSPYVHVEPKRSLSVPLCLQSEKSLFSDYHCLLVFSGIYYGVFVLVFFYNLVAFMQTRSRNYLFYLVFLGSFALIELSFDGLGRLLLWSDFNWMIMQGRGAFVGIMILSFVLFSRSFLKTEVFAPKLDKLLLLLALLLFVLTLGGLFFSNVEVVLTMASVALVLFPVFLFLGLKAYKNKFRPARFYSAGVGSFLFMGILLSMDQFGWTEDLYLFIYSQQAASVLAMIFISCALADLLKKTEHENLENLNSLNHLLQEKLEKTLSQLRRNDNVLIEKSRLAAMGEKIEQIAHQWRQPLHALALINQNLYFKTQLNTVTKEDYEEVHDKMNEQLQYMSQTIDDFRNFSKSNKKKEAFFIETVIKSAISLSEGSLEQANVKTQLISKGEHTAYGMCHELMQVFMNLIKNAHDEILEKKIQEPWIRFSVTAQKNQTQICIEDNAGGIPEDTIKRVFRPYFSTKEASGGSGIGLYMSKEIIERSMLGRISVANSENGAVFTVLLPKTTKKVSKN